MGKHENLQPLEGFSQCSSSNSHKKDGRQNGAMGKATLKCRPKEGSRKGTKFHCTILLREANSVTHRDTLKTHFGWGKLKEKMSLLLNFKQKPS